MNHMSYEIKGKLDYHIMNLRSILPNLDQAKKKSDPNEILGKTILGKGVNALASDFFESNFAGKLGEKWVLGKIKMQEKYAKVICAIENLSRYGRVLPCICYT